MRFYFTFSIVLGFYLLGQSQDYQVISCGAGYNKQSYIKLFEGSQKQVKLYFNFIRYINKVVSAM